MMNGKNVFGVVCALFSSMTMTAQNAPQLGNATLDDVINAMTIDEKISIVTGTGDDDVPTGTTDMLAMIGSTRKIVPGAAGLLMPFHGLAFLQSSWQTVRPEYALTLQEEEQTALSIVLTFPSPLCLLRHGTFLWSNPLVMQWAMRRWNMVWTSCSLQR
mgnify:CR=1 FL=1